MGITKHKIYLFLAGGLLILIGSFIGFFPAEYLAQFFDSKEFSLDSRSEMRGMGGSLFILGLFIVGGAYIKRIEETALIISTLIFGAFSMFRIFGIIFDGVPSHSIVIALSIEIVFAVLAMLLLVAHQPNSQLVSNQIRFARLN